MARDKYGLIIPLGAEYKECAYCALDFVPATPRQKYCSMCVVERKQAYARAYYRVYKRDIPRTPLKGRVCARCEEKYDAVSGNQKHCKSCARLIRNERSLKYYYAKKEKRVFGDC